MFSRDKLKRAPSTINAWSDSMSSYCSVKPNRSNRSNRDSSSRFAAVSILSKTASKSKLFVLSVFSAPKRSVTSPVSDRRTAIFAPSMLRVETLKSPRKMSSSAICVLMAPRLTKAGLPFCDNDTWLKSNCGCHVSLSPTVMSLKSISTCGIKDLNSTAMRSWTICGTRRSRPFITKTKAPPTNINVTHNATDVPKIARTIGCFRNQTIAVTTRFTKSVNFLF